MGAGEALRRVLECLASGIVMPDGSGIHDPCEKEATDAIGHLDRQQREDITQSAQHVLRLAAFGQLHKVLGMDPLPSKMPKKPKNVHPVDYTGKEAVGPGPRRRCHHGLLAEDRLESQVLPSSSCFSSNTPQHHLRHYTHETPDGGRWRGKVS